MKGKRKYRLKPFTSKCMMLLLALTIIFTPAINLTLRNYEPDKSWELADNPIENESDTNDNSKEEKEIKKDDQQFRSWIIDQISINSNEQAYFAHSKHLKIIYPDILTPPPKSGFCI